MTDPAPATGSKAEGIVWLASFPKSGNTWTRTFLHNLLNVLKGEDDGTQDINQMNEYTTWDISAKSYADVLGKDPTEASREEIARARPRVQLQIADETDGLIFVKTHNALVIDRGVPTINTDVTSGVVYIVRNPLDVAISFGHHMSQTTDAAIRAMEAPGYVTRVSENSVYEVYGSWSQHVYSWTRKPNPALFVMRYEDMHAEPEQTFGALARHLLMSPSKEQLQRAIDLSSFDKLQKLEEAHGFREKPKQAERFFRKGTPDQWKDELTQAQVDRIVRVHGEQMRRFGYLD